VKKAEDSVFNKEYEIYQAAEAMLKKEEVEPGKLFEQFMVLLKHYKRLLRQIEIVTRLSDNQQMKLNKILERLGRYVSFQLFRKITDGKDKGEIKTQRKKLTVFFSDLKDFSYVSSHIEGEMLAQFLNSYLEAMTQIVIKWKGTLDKYMGDAIMVFFGDPEFTSDEDHALRCVSMAIEMRDKMKELRRKWYGLGFQEPLHFRVGVSTGYCTVGNFGSSERMDYTIIGSAVNLASRLETAADLDEILISHETWSYVKEKIICEPPHALHLKGFHHPILAHKVLNIKKKDKNSLIVLNDDLRGLNLKIDFSKISKEELLAIIYNLKPETDIKTTDHSD